MDRNFYGEMEGPYYTEYFPIASIPGGIVTNHVDRKLAWEDIQKYVKFLQARLELTAGSFVHVVYEDSFAKDFNNERRKKDVKDTSV